MEQHVLIAHADGDENIAEVIAKPLRVAGYQVTHKGTIVVGESTTAEMSKLLSVGAPVILCATVRAMGTGWSHRIVTAARSFPNTKVFVVQIESAAYVDPLSLGDRAIPYWKDPDAAISELLTAFAKYYPLNDQDKELLSGLRAEARYRQLALEACDIIDLANLPEDDRHVATRALELRRLYVPQYVLAHVSSDGSHPEASVEDIAKRRMANILLRPFVPGLEERAGGESSNQSIRLPVGERLHHARRLVVLGDPGSGKSTLVRWLATAYLLRLNNDQAWKSLPASFTLPDVDWLPIVIRCRDLDKLSIYSLDQILSQTLRKSEMTDREIEAFRSLIKDRLRDGKAILLLDGLDEIGDPADRSRFCRQIETISIAYPRASIVATSRIVGYREIGQRIGRNFEHVTIDDLTHQEKDRFARKWCELTEVPERRQIAASELIQDIHSSDRIEQLTGNPMLLTTMALVKRKVGRLPSRRADLYWDALEVLLNWRREVDDPIDHREAVPQLEYIAFAMCNAGVQQYREDQILDLIEQMRAEYPNIRAARQHSPSEFLRLMERRTGLLVETGRTRHKGILTPVFEFRHLTFQEYLAARALVDGRYPGREKDRTLSEQIAPLAGTTTEIQVGSRRDRVVNLNWQEALRLCISLCNDDDVDSSILAILTPLKGEDAKITGRSRSVLAAFCLVDEPYVSSEIAEQVLQSFCRHTVKLDCQLDGWSSIRIALPQLARSCWGERLRILMAEEYYRRGELSVSGPAGACAIIACEQALAEGITLWLTRAERDLSDDDEVESCARILGMGKLAYDDESGVPSPVIDPIISMLSGNQCVALVAAWTLGGAYSYSKDDQRWQISTDQLARLRDVAFNSDTPAEVALYLVVLLGLERDPMAAEPLVGLLASKPRLRSTAARALGRIRDPRYIPALVNLLTDSNSDVREASVRSLGYMEDHALIEHLARCIHDPDSAVAIAAVQSVAGFDIPEAGTVILPALDDNRTAVRRAAAESLVNFPSEDALVKLLIKVNDPDQRVRSTVINSLSIYQDRRVIQVMDALITDPDVCEDAAEALGNIGSEEAFISLGKHLRMNDENGKRSAVSGLTTLALKHFHTGDVKRAIAVFGLMANAGVEDAKNSLAYCFILIGDLERAEFELSNISRKWSNRTWPFSRHNAAIISALKEDSTSAVEQLTEVLDWINEANDADQSTACMLLLDGVSDVYSHRGLPFDAAVLCNLCTLGQLSRDQLQDDLRIRYPDEIDEWMETWSAVGISSLACIASDSASLGET